MMIQIPAELWESLLTEDSNSEPPSQPRAATSHLFQPYNPCTTVDWEPTLLCGYGGCGASQRNQVHLD